jgi:amidohydrolase
VEIEGTARAVDKDIREYLRKRIQETAKGISETLRGSYELEYTYGYPPVINDEEFTKKFVESAKKIIPEEDIITMKKPAMGGEDMAYFLEEAPGTFFFINNPMAVEGVCYPNHNSRFNIDESYLGRGAALLIQASLDYLDNK